MEGYIVIVISPQITEKEIFLVEVAPCQDQKIFLLVKLTILLIILYPIWIRRVFYS